MSVQRDSFRLTLHNRSPVFMCLTLRPRSGVLRIREGHDFLVGTPEMTCDWSGVFYEWWTVLQRGPSFSKLVWEIPANVTQSCWLYFDNALEISLRAQGSWYDEEEGEYIYYPSNNDIVLKTIVGDVFACDGGKKATHASVHIECDSAEKKKQALFIIEGTDRSEYLTK